MFRSFTLASLLLLAASCSQRMYTAKAIAPQTLAQHKLVAILPFEVQLDRLRMQDISYAGRTVLTPDSLQQHPQQWRQRQQAQCQMVAYQLQQQLHTRLAAQQAKHPYSVRFQNVTETNYRLQQAGITYANLNDHSMAELKAALGVDAVLSGETSLFQPLPNGMTVALLVLTNASVAANEVLTNVTIHDCQSGALVWKFDHQLVGDMSTSPATLARVLVRNSARTFPYRR